MIYFIRNRTNRAIKIGFTRKDARERLGQLQTACPNRLELIGTMPGDMTVEKGLHKRFAEHRLTGEWFREHEELVEAIDVFLKVREQKKAHDDYWQEHWEPLVPMLNFVVSEAMGFDCECAHWDLGMVAYAMGDSKKLVSNKKWKFEPTGEGPEHDAFCARYDDSEFSWKFFDTPVEAAFFFVRLRAVFGRTT